MGEWRRLLGVALRALLVVVAGCGMAMGIHLELVVIGLALALFAVVTSTAALLAVRHARLTANLREAAVLGLADGVEVEIRVDDFCSPRLAQNIGAGHLRFRRTCS